VLSRFGWMIFGQYRRFGGGFNLRLIGLDPPRMPGVFTRQDGCYLGWIGDVFAPPKSTERVVDDKMVHVDLNR
jgi:hypothetical protein